MSTKFHSEVSILGAGPYGLAAAAHLRAAGLQTIVYGRTLSFWKEHMPRGMLLRSSWGASHISDPHKSWSFDAYQAQRETNISKPIPKDDFVQYGEWFQQQAVPDLDQRTINLIRPVQAGYELVLEDGQVVTTRHMVIAAGILPFTHIPAVFAGLPQAFVSHSAYQSDLSIFANQRVIVIGSGQSAIESAALLVENGAQVEVIARAPLLRWLNRSSWLHARLPIPIRHILYHPSDIGPPGINQIIAHPFFFRRLPSRLQRWMSYRAIRPAAAGWLRRRAAEIPMSFKRRVQSAAVKAREVLLELSDGSQLSANHILLATGYQIDLHKYPFFAPELLDKLAMLQGYPVLSSGMKSSLPGLYFLGAPAALSFGPLMRFVAGTDFAGRQLAMEILANREGDPLQSTHERITSLQERVP